MSVFFKNYGIVVRYLGVTYSFFCICYFIWQHGDDIYSCLLSSCCNMVCW